MKLEFLQNLRLEQQLRMSPQLIQRIEILQLPALNLQELIEQEMSENDALELTEPMEEMEASKDGEGDEKKDEFDGTDENGLDDSYQLEADLERLNNLAEWNQDYRPSASGSSRGEADPKMEAMQNTLSRPETLQDYLKDQLDLSDAASDLKILAEQIIYNINDRGYLMYPLEEIYVPQDIEFTQERREEALALVQSFDPRGVGARDLQECLLLQIDESLAQHHLLRRIVQNHIEDVSKNRLPKIAKETGESIPTIQEVIESISHLEPIPGRNFKVENIPYVKPDVVVELIEGEYEIRLENNYYPKLGISAAYIRMYRDKNLDPKLRKHLREKIESAKWLIESIEQRKSTLSRVVHEMLAHQREFLDHGVKFLKPLKMQEIADKLNIHVSTVSRAISDKYVQTHRGIFPLKYFFTGATKSSDGSVESRMGVKQKVKEIIDGEDKAHPLSDQEIVEKLKKEGLDIARRTVTKYRKALKVPSSRQRRVYS